MALFDPSNEPGGAVNSRSFRTFPSLLERDFTPAIAMVPEIACALWPKAALGDEVFGARRLDIFVMYPLSHCRSPARSDDTGGRAWAWSGATPAPRQGKLGFQGVQAHPAMLHVEDYEIDDQIGNDMAEPRGVKTRRLGALCGPAGRLGGHEEEGADRQLSQLTIGPRAIRDA
jgi:hypothetical protein